MSFRRITGAWTPLTFVKRWTGSAWVDVSFVKRRTATGWQQVWPASGGLFASSDVAEAFGEFTCTYNGMGSNTCPVVQRVVSIPVTVVASGGSGAGPTYAWTYLDGDTGITVSNASSSVVTFAANVTRRRTRTGTWRCTATRGVDTAVVDIPIILSYDYSADGEVLP